MWIVKGMLLARGCNLLLMSLLEDAAYYCYYLPEAAMYHRRCLLEAEAYYWCYLKEAAVYHWCYFQEAVGRLLLMLLDRACSLLLVLLARDCSINTFWQPIYKKNKELTKLWQQSAVKLRGTLTVCKLNMKIIILIPIEIHQCRMDNKPNALLAYVLTNHQNLPFSGGIFSAPRNW